MGQPGNVPANHAPPFGFVKGRTKDHFDAI
jgi:hypothetical protein